MGLIGDKKGPLPVVFPEDRRELVEDTFASVFGELAEERFRHRGGVGDSVTYPPGRLDLPLLRDGVNLDVHQAGSREQLTQAAGVAIVDQSGGGGFGKSGSARRTAPPKICMNPIRSGVDQTLTAIRPPGLTTRFSSATPRAGSGKKMIPRFESATSKLSSSSSRSWPSMTTAWTSSPSSTARCRQRSTM